MSIKTSKEIFIILKENDFIAKSSRRVKKIILIINNGGEREIRTLGPASGTTVFETAPFNHSGTSPENSSYTFTRLIIFKLNFITMTINNEPKMFASKSNLLKVRLGMNN